LDEKLKYEKKEEELKRREEELKKNEDKNTYLKMAGSFVLGAVLMAAGVPPILI
jgi:hypothetical protein